MQDELAGNKPGVATGNQAASDTAGDISVIPPAISEELPSGKWLQRAPRTLHRDLIRLAQRERVSLNQLVTALLSEAVGARRPKVRRGGQRGKPQGIRAVEGFGERQSLRNRQE